MKRFFVNAIAQPFWAGPNNSIYDLMLGSSDVSAIRHARALSPGFPMEDPVPETPVRPVRPLPTDVPATEPRDIPVRNPTDIPPPDPGQNPKPVKPEPRRPDSKPGRTP
jgi:hypothetical protein